MKVLKIGARWCSGCIVMGPRWKKIEQENTWLVTKYYDFDESPEIVEKYNLESGVLPTFIFLNKDGEEISRLSGELSEKEILKTITEYKDK